MARPQPFNLRQLEYHLKHRYATVHRISRYDSGRVLYVFLHHWSGGRMLGHLAEYVVEAQLREVDFTILNATKRGYDELESVMRDWGHYWSAPIPKWRRQRRRELKALLQSWRLEKENMG